MSKQTNNTPTEIPRYWDTFLDAPPKDNFQESARVILLPIPYDSTTSYKGGTRHGPKAIITASKQLEDYDLEFDQEISEIGIYTSPEIVPNISGPKAMVNRVKDAVRSISNKHQLVGLLGGEHSITIGAVQALRETYTDLTVLYLDAHADLRDTYMGSRWGHASVARRIHEMCPILEVGVRSLSVEEKQFTTDTKIDIFFWPQNTSSMESLWSNVVKKLSAHTYISIDLDVFDPSIMSAVGTPEPGGMKWEEVTSLLKKVGESSKIVGFDITELSPYEGPEACAFTAAKLTYKLIGYSTLL